MTARFALGSLPRAKLESQGAVCASRASRPVKTLAAPSGAPDRC